MIKEYIIKIQKAFKNQSYEQYEPLLMEYKTYLGNRLKENNSDVIAVCQLATLFMELREDKEKTIQILEDFLERNSTKLDSDSLFRIYTNLSYYFHQEEGEKGIEYLKKSLLYKETDINYDVLARFYLDEVSPVRSVELFKKEIPEYYKKALEMSEKAFHLTQNKDIKYNYGVILYDNRKYEQAQKVFENLLKEDPDNSKYLFASVMCFAYLKEFEKVKNILSKLEKEEDFFEDFFCAEEIYFLIGEYEKYIQAIEKANYAWSISWLSPYFYSLKVTGQTKKLREILEKYIQKIEEDIEDSKTDSDFTIEEGEEYRMDLENDKKEIIELAEKILENPEKPNLEIPISLEYYCHLIDCLRHNKNLDMILK